LGAIDLPIQRERTTDYPMVQGSSIKGSLRARAHSQLDETTVHAIFGPETADASAHAGALSIGDARILLFPVRSLAGVFAWTTSSDALARFGRAAAIAGVAGLPALPPAPASDAALVGNTCSLKAGDSIVLEEFSFRPDDSQAGAVDKLATWLAANALPTTPEYDYWRNALPGKLCVLHDDAFHDFVRYGTEVQTHVMLKEDTKTVAKGALWTSESLPTDSLLYAPLMATSSRMKDVSMEGQEVLRKGTSLDLVRAQLGGDETTGQGIMALRFSKGGHE